MRRRSGSKAWRAAEAAAAATVPITACTQMRAPMNAYHSAPPSWLLPPVATCMQLPSARGSGGIVRSMPSLPATRSLLVFHAHSHIAQSTARAHSGPRGGERRGSKSSAVAARLACPLTAVQSLAAMLAHRQPPQTMLLQVLDRQLLGGPGARPGRPANVEERRTGREKLSPPCRGSNPNQTGPPPDAGAADRPRSRPPAAPLQCTAAPLWPSSRWREHAAAR